MGGDHGQDRERAGPTRREFLGYGAAGGAFLLAGPAACGSGDAGSPGKDLREPGPVPPVPAFEAEEVSIAELGEGLASGRWTSRRLAADEGIDAAMDRHRLDAIVAPTGGPAWVTDLVNRDHFAGSSSEPPAIAGYPNVTVPAGFVHELPVGISIFGRPWSEPTLLRIAHGFERATRHRVPPRFLRSVPA